MGKVSLFNCLMEESMISIWKSSVEDFLVQQGIDDALLLKEKPNNVEAARWTQMRKKAVSTIRLAIAPEIKYHYLKETDPGELLEKLQSVYASKSLTNKLCLRWEFYQLMKDEDTTMQDHINTFNKLVCQLLNADEKFSDEEQALLLLASLPKDYRNIVQKLLIGRDSITLDQALAALRENDRFMVRREGEEKKDVGDGLFSEGSNGGRTKEKYQGRGRSRGRDDLSNKECYYCKKKGHIQMMCKKFKEDLKRMRNLKDSGRIENESSGNAALGFIDDDDDYDGALLVDGGVVHSKE